MERPVMTEPFLPRAAVKDTTTEETRRGERVSSFILDWMTFARSPEQRKLESRRDKAFFRSPQARLLDEGRFKLLLGVIAVDQRASGARHRRDQPRPVPGNLTTAAFLFFNMKHKLLGSRVVIHQCDTRHAD